MSGQEGVRGSAPQWNTSTTWQAIGGNSKKDSLKQRRVEIREVIETETPQTEVRTLLRVGIRRRKNGHTPTEMRVTLTVLGPIVGWASVGHHDCFASR